MGVPIPHPLLHGNPPALGIISIDSLSPPAFPHPFLLRQKVVLLIVAAQGFPPFAVPLPHQILVLVIFIMVLISVRPHLPDHISKGIILPYSPGSGSAGSVFIQNRFHLLEPVIPENLFSSISPVDGNISASAVIANHFQHTSILIILNRHYF